MRDAAANDFDRADPCILQLFLFEGATSLVGRSASHRHSKLLFVHAAVVVLEQNLLHFFDIDALIQRSRGALIACVTAVARP